MTTVNLDLFGDMTPDAPLHKGRQSKYQAWKAKNNYRKAGCLDQRCGTCAHHLTVRFSKNYHKCSLLGNSASVATDIRVSAVCDRWEG